jgi:tetratricopeptide (TPR) repeat protein
LSSNNVAALTSVLFFGLVTAGGAGNVFSGKGAGTRGPTVLSLEPGARNAGVAGAFAMTPIDGEALFGNPAGLQHLATRELRLTGGTLPAEQTQTSLSYAHPFWRRGERETWGAYVQSLSLDAFDVYENGDPIGQAHPQDWVAGIAYARPAPFGNWGLAVKGVSTETFESKAMTGALDFGLQGGGARWEWGAGVTNMGPSFKLGEETVGLPTRIRVGLNRRWANLSAALLGDFPSDNDPAAGLGVEWETEWAKSWRAALRAGARTSGNTGTLGAGISRGPLSIQYAFTPMDDQGTLGQLDLVYRFGREPPLETRRRELTREARAHIDRGNFGKTQSVLDDIFIVSPRYRPARALQQELRRRISETLDPDTLLDLGRRNVAAGDDTAAVDNFRKLLLVQPDHKDGKMELAQAETRIAERRANRLREEVARARALDRKRLTQNARSLEEIKKWEEALDIWHKIHKSNGGQDASEGMDRCRAALYHEAEKNQKSNDVDQARLLFLAADKGGPYKDAGSRARAMDKLSAERRADLALKKYRAGQEAYVKGDLETALHLFHAASELDPTNLDARQAYNHLQEERRLKEPRPNHQR